jgi:hypothetical protein
MSLTDLNVGAEPAAESGSSAVSWGPIIAGSVAATAITLLLTLFGSGFGLTMVSPFASEGVSATTFAVSTAIGLIVIQWISAAFGGYLTGRLRTKWSGVHTNEVYFRDTAHGFVSWAIATLFLVAVLGSAISSTIGAGVQAASGVASGAASTAAGAAAGSDSTDYFVDSLLRPGSPAAASAEQAGQAASQVSRILLNAAATGEMPADDRAYLDQLVAARTGLSEAEAKARVAGVLTRIDEAGKTAREAAEAARKAGTTTVFMTAFSLLIGAFISSVAAAIGGRQRDEDEEGYLRTAPSPYK